MKIYRIAKTVSEFSFHQELDSLWNNLLRQEMEKSNIHFDLENNEPCEVKTRQINWSPDDDSEFRIKAQICWAGGDWEASICYFRCQIDRRHYFDRKKSWGRWNSFIKTIIIPIKNNINLVKGKDGYVANDADNDEKRDSDKALWDEMVTLAEKRLKAYWQAYTNDGYLDHENTNCIRNLADLKS